VKQKSYNLVEKWKTACGRPIVTISHQNSLRLSAHFEPLRQTVRNQGYPRNFRDVCGLRSPDDGVEQRKARNRFGAAPVIHPELYSPYCISHVWQHHVEYLDSRRLHRCRPPPWDLTRISCSTPLGTNHVAGLVTKDPSHCPPPPLHPSSERIPRVRSFAPQQPSSCGSYIQNATRYTLCERRDSPSGFEQPELGLKHLDVHYRIPGGLDNHNIL